MRLSRAGLAFALLAALVVAVPAGVALAADHTCDGRAATWVGTDGADTFTDTVGADDVIVALGGNDVIETGTGNDVVCAGDGTDVVRSGAGNDRVWGEGGPDFLYGGSGSDALWGGAGSDVVEGGTGSDQIFGESGNDELWGGSCVNPTYLSYFCRVAPAAANPDGGEGTVGGFDALLGGARILRSGSSGEDVAELQELLNELGFPPGPVDGKFGSLTAGAVRDFQAAKGLTVDGAVGPQTREALAAAASGLGVSALSLASTGAVAVDVVYATDLFGSTRLLGYGSRGEDVADLQGILNDLGYAAGPVDGIFGQLTASAVRAFQAHHGLAADGIVGPQTKAALQGDSGVGDALDGGADYDTCNSPEGGGGCENQRGIRTGAPWNTSAAEEWRPLVTEVFTAWGIAGEIERALAIVACESLADPFITTPSSPEGASVIGIFQHKDVYWESRVARAGIPGGDPYSPRDNAIVAAMLVSESKDGGHTNGPWGHFACGSSLGFWPDTGS